MRASGGAGAELPASEAALEQPLATRSPERPADRPPRDATLTKLAVFAVGVLAASLVLDAQLLNVGIFAGIFALAAVGLQLMMGLAGQANLGQAAFFAIGAYTSAILVTRYDADPVLAGVAAIALTMLFGYVVGLPLLRLKGYYLALATFGFGIIVAVLANELSFLGHATGIFGVPKLRLGGFKFTSPTSYFLLVWAILGLMVALAANLTRSRKGRALGALHESEIAAETLGIDTFRLRLEVLVLCSAMGSIAGTLYVHWVSVINPAAASFLLSIRFIVIATVGGLLSIWGAVVGAIFVEGLAEALQTTLPKFVSGSAGEWQLIVFGLVLTAVLVFVPGGIAGVATDVGAWLRRRRSRHIRPDEQPSSDPDADETDIRFGNTSPREVDLSALPGVRTEDRPTSGTTILQVRAVTKDFGGVRAVDSVDLDVRAGEIVALIGPNGAGKTTLFNVVTGVIPPSHGTVTIHGEPVAGATPHRIARLGTARTFQNLELFGSMSVLDNIKVGRHMRSRGGFLAGALVFPRRAEERAVEAAAVSLAELVGLDDVLHRRASDLPFGRQRLLELARALALEPDLLLLDEPMAGLTARERTHLAELLRTLRTSSFAILLVEHDVDAVMALADRIVVLDNGVRIATGTPEQVRNDDAVIEAYLGGGIDYAELKAHA